MALKAVDLAEMTIPFPALSRGSQNGVCCFHMLCYYVNIINFLILIRNLKKAWAHINEIQRPEISEFSTPPTRNKFTWSPKSHGVYYNYRQVLFT